MIWKIETKEDYKLYTSNECALKVFEKDEIYEIQVNYKGYNLLMPLELWGFQEEIKERHILYSIHEGANIMKEGCFVVNREDLRIFIDLIYFFIKEHNMNGALNEKLKFKSW